MVKCWGCEEEYDWEEYVQFDSLECGEEIEDDCYCDYCGWPNNQGWIGENY